MANYFTDNQDLLFYLEKGVDWEPLVKITEYDFKAEDGHPNTEEALDFYRSVAELVGELSAEQIHPIGVETDETGLTFSDGEVHFPESLQSFFESVKEMDLHSMCLPRELGGMNCPMLLYFINTELMGRGDVSVAAHHGFHGGIAMALLLYSLTEGSSEFQTDPPRIAKTRFETEIADIASGNAWGSMDITEANAGSDMAALKCRATQDENGNWFLSGEKIFITSGHGKYHIVIARTEKADEGDPFAGLAGLSLFLVPTYEEDDQGAKTWHSTIGGIEKKLGHNGSATVTMSFDNTPCHLIGKRGEGFKNMLLLMNNARIGVGFESLGLMEAAVRMSRAYAEERPSMGKNIAQHEMIAEMLDTMENDVQAIRALAVHAAFHEEMSQKLRLKLVAFSSKDDPDRAKLERQQAFHQKASRAVTPLIKYIASEKAVDMARQNLQIHGGYGYIKEYGAEKLLRDALIFPIYEGTSQIQALMAMKDTLMGVIKDFPEFLRQATIATTKSLNPMNPLERRVARIQVQCNNVIRHLMTKMVTQKLGFGANGNGNGNGNGRKGLGELLKSFQNWDPKKDFAPAMLHAERLCKMLTHRAICEVLLEQAEKFPEREEILRKYLERAEPEVTYLSTMITTTGGRLLNELAHKDDPAKEPAGV